MKHNTGLLFLIIGFLFSCSTDENKIVEKTEQDSIEGTWAATELKIGSNSSAEAQFGKQALDYLTANDCIVLTFIFNDDSTVIAKNATAYLDVGVTANGLDIPCPTESDSTTSTYSYDGKVLTVIDENGEELVVAVTISGDTMTVDAADLDIDNFNEEGELIFKRE